MDRIDRSRAPDLLQLLVLVLAAGVYVGSAYFLWEVSWTLASIENPC